VNRWAQDKELVNLKAEMSEYKQVGSHVLQNVVARVDTAFQNFFRRVKRGEKPGYPRFQGRDRYDSFVFPDRAGWKLEGRRLVIKNVGTFKLFLSREVLGDIKTVTIRHTSTGKWFVSFSCDNVPEKILESCQKEIGIDVGLKVFLADSDGNFVENPHFFRESERELRVKQRKLSRAKYGSSRRKNTKLQVSKVHEKITNQRKDFINKIVLKYVQENGTIYIEDLQVKNMIKNKHLSKSIADASWAQFTSRLTVAAAEAKRSVVKVNPRNTSQTCLCGEMVKKSLAVRVHRCPVCSLEMDRDTLAAKNILRFGQNRQVQTSPLGLVA
jgi:putative transposase